MFVGVCAVLNLQNSVKPSLKPSKHKLDITLLKPSKHKPSKHKPDIIAQPEIPPVIDVTDDPPVPVSLVDQEACEIQPVSNNDQVTLVKNEETESASRSSIAEGRPGEHRTARMQLRNLSPKNFGHYQLEYKHWLHMSGYQVAKRRRYIRKRSGAGLAQRRPIGVGLARQRPIAAGLVRRGPITTSRPTKLLRLHSSDRPAIKSAGPSEASRAATNLLRLPQNVVDVKTVDAAVSASGDQGTSDGLQAAIKLHFGAVARIKAGAKCRIMARRWTDDDRLEYLVQWDAGIVT